MTSFTSWNVRGINHPSKQVEVRQLIDKFDIGLLAVLEAKISLACCVNIASRCYPSKSWKSFSFGDDPRSKNRILLLWNPDVFCVNIWFANAQVVICEVVWNGKKFMACFVYAFNSQRERLPLWEIIVDAMDKVRGPWICLGDFNCIKSQAEKLNGARVCDADVRELTYLCDQSGLFDMAANGNLFTWSDRHLVGRQIWSKLDRLLCNEELMDIFPGIHGLFPNPGISDHSPAIPFLGIRPLIKKWFHFQALWTRTDEFKDCLAQKWQKGSRDLFQFQRCLKFFKADLKVAMREFRGNMNIRVEQSRQLLVEAQSMLATNPNDSELRRIETLELLNFRKLLKYQYIFNCQKARLNRAKEEDLNTKYFHSVINGRKSRAAICCIELQDGDFSFDPGTINFQFVHYFQELFNEDFRRKSVDQTLFSSGPKVEEGDCFLLVKDISLNEVAEVIRNMPSCKAAGPDGFSAEFFKASWEVIEWI